MTGCGKHSVGAKGAHMADMEKAELVWKILTLVFGFNLIFGVMGFLIGYFWPKK